VRPASLAPERRPVRVRRPALLGELIVVLVLVKVYDQVRALEAARAGTALHNAHGVLAVERWLHLDVELSANHWMAGHHTLSLVMSWWYQLAHLTVTLAVLGWCYLRRPDAYRSARNALVLTNVAGLAVFFVLPVMPPRLLPGGGYVDSVAAAGFGSSHTGPVPADQYAAMPSLHLAWAVWTASVAMLLLSRYRLRVLLVLYPAVTAVAVVVTGNHYVLDVLAGVLVAVLALLASRAQITLRRTRMARTQAPGSSGTQTVSSRYASTVARAVADGVPTATRPATRATSRAPKPPGDGTSAETDEATR
jgi:membrane-associated phospholipid phosphatase